MSRLREAEQRDTEQNRGVMHHLAAMHALDTEVLDGIEERGEDSSVVMPSVDEIRQLIKLAWAGSSLLRRAKHDSFTACEGDFAMRPIDAIDQETFEKFMMVVQHPAEMRHAGRFHSAAQRRGWSTLFLSIDADRTNSLTLAELVRFLERQQRAQAVALDALKEEQSGNRIQLPRDAAAKGKGAAATAVAMVAAAAAAAAGKAPPPSATAVKVPPKAREARERLVQNNFSDQMARLRAAEAAEGALSAAATEGCVADDLFELTASVAPPLFQCVEARLLLCRHAPKEPRTAPKEPGGPERCPELYTHPPAGRAHEIVISIDSYTLPGYTMVTKEPQNVPNVRLCSRFDPDEYGHSGYVLPSEAIRSTVCIPIFAEKPEEDAPAGARPPLVGCLQLFNRVPRGVAWNADRSTYEGPVEFDSRDLAQARSFCEKLSPAISAGQRVQQRLDAEEAVRAAERARRIEELQRRKAYVEQQNASFVAHKERGHGGQGYEHGHRHGHGHEHGRHDGREHGPSPPSPPSVAAAASSPSAAALSSSGPAAAALSSSGPAAAASSSSGPAAASSSSSGPAAAASSSSGPATAQQRPAQPKASPNVGTQPVATAQRTAAAPPPALPTPPPTPPRKSKFDTLKTTPRKSMKKKKPLH